MLNDFKDLHFLTADVAQLTDLPERKILSYVERGYVKPSVREAAGPGTKRVWSYQDLVRLTTVKFLLKQLSVEAVRKIAACLGRDDDILPTKRMRVGDEIDLSLEQEAVNALAGRSPVPVEIVIDFSVVHAYVQDRLRDGPGGGD